MITEHDIFYEIYCRTSRLYNSPLIVFNAPPRQLPDLIRLDSLFADSQFA